MKLSLNCLKKFWKLECPVTNWGLGNWHRTFQISMRGKYWRRSKGFLKEICTIWKWGIAVKNDLSPSPFHRFQSSSHYSKRYGTGQSRWGNISDLVVFVPHFHTLFLLFQRKNFLPRLAGLKRISSLIFIPGTFSWVLLVVYNNAPHLHPWLKQGDQQKLTVLVASFVSRTSTIFL